MGGGGGGKYDFEKLIAHNIKEFECSRLTETR